MIENQSSHVKELLVKTAVIILAHGSKSGDAGDSVRRTAAAVKKQGGYEIVEYAFLQHTPPSPQDALESCIKQQAERVVVVPFFMQSGAHVARDIPSLVENARKKYPGVEFVVTDCAGSHTLMAKIVMDLVGKGDRGLRSAE